MKIIIIAAVAKNGVIGKDGKMPWHFKEELLHFKRTTLGYPILMGRKTFESFGGVPLKKRTNVIITRQKEFNPPGENVAVFNDIKKGLEFCDSQLQAEKVFIIGGEEIYRQAMEFADGMILSRLRYEFEGDTYFPSVDKEKWEIMAREEKEDFIIVTYKKK